MKRSPDPVANRSPEWPCLPKGRDLMPMAYRRSDFRPVPAGLMGLLDSMHDFKSAEPWPRDHLKLADSIAAAEPFTVLLFTEPLAEAHWGRRKYMDVRRVKIISEIDETVFREFHRELDERMSDYLKDHRDPEDAYLNRLVREYYPKARAILRGEYRERYPRAWRQKWQSRQHEQPRTKLKRRRLYEMPKPLGHHGEEAAQQFYFMRRTMSFTWGCGAGSGSREAHSYFALALLELQRRGAFVPSYVMVYDRDNRLRFVDAWSVPLVLPNQIGCNCAVDREIVWRLVNGAWKATAERRRDWTRIARINVWKDRDPAEYPKRA